MGRTAPARVGDMVIISKKLARSRIILVETKKTGTRNIVPHGREILPRD